MKTRNIKTKQFLELAQRQFGLNIQIEYKPSGLTSGWYLSKNGHSYCVGKNAFEATLWLTDIPNKRAEPHSAWDGYIDYEISNQLRKSESTEKSHSFDYEIKFNEYDGQSIPKIIRNCINLGRLNTAIIPLVWLLGIPVKRLLGYYPNLVLTGSGKSTMLSLTLNFVGTKRNNFRIGGSRNKEYLVHPQDLLSLDSNHNLPLEPSRPFYPSIISTKRYPLAVFDTALEIEYLSNPKFGMDGHGFYVFPIRTWMSFLVSIPREDLFLLRNRCHLEYCRIHAPPHLGLNDINNNILLLLVWKLLCRFIEPVRTTDLTTWFETVDSVTTSILTLQPVGVRS